jgi:membrane-associated progesterone receptor component
LAAGGGYHLFSGKEVSRALGKMAIKADECNADLTDFTEREHKVLSDWEEKFKQKYAIVGKVSLLARSSL